MSRPKTTYPSKVQSFYNSISHFYSLISFVDNKAKNRGISFSEPKKGDKVLCVGFGLGEEIKKYNSLGCNTYGLEFSGGMIKSARKRNSLKNLAKGDTFHLPYKDKSFDFVTKTSPAAVQLLQAAKIKSGSGEPNRDKVASVTWNQIKVIAEDKMADLNAFKIESAMKMVAGTARSMGIIVKGQFPG